MFFDYIFIDELLVSDGSVNDPGLENQQFFQLSSLSLNFNKKDISFCH